MVKQKGLEYGKIKNKIKKKEITISINTTIYIAS